MSLYQITKDLCEDLRQDDFFRQNESKLALSYTDAGDVVNEIDRALSEMGLAVNIRSLEWTPKANAGHESVGFALLTLAVGEVPSVNRAGGESFVSGQDIAEHLAWLLNGRILRGTVNPLILKEGPRTTLAENGAVAITTIVFQFKYFLSNNLEAL